MSKTIYVDDHTIDITSDTENLTIDGNLIVTGDLSVSGTITGALDLDSDMSITGDLTVGGDQTIDGALEVAGDLTVDTNITVVGTVTATNYLFALNQRLLKTVPLYQVFIDAFNTKDANLTVLQWQEASLAGYAGVSTVLFGSAVNATYTYYVDITPWVPNNSKLYSVQLYMLNPIGFDPTIKITAQTSGSIGTGLFTDRGSDSNAISTNTSLVLETTYVINSTTINTNTSMVRLKIEQTAGSADQLELYKVVLNIDTTSLSVALGTT